MNQFKTAHLLLLFCAFFTFKFSDLNVFSFWIIYSAIVNSKTMNGLHSTCITYVVHNHFRHHTTILKQLAWWTALPPDLWLLFHRPTTRSWIISMPLVSIMYAKCLTCWRIKNPWSSSGRLPEALSSSLHLWINRLHGDKRRTSALPSSTPLFNGVLLYMLEVTLWNYLLTNWGCA